jgi:broad specificity phosphatase PhoE
MTARCMNTRFHLVRHGRVAPEWHDRIYGDLDVPLSDVGEAELRSVADALADAPLDAVLSSGLARAEFGAALLRAPRGLPRRDEPELREISRGAWRGLTFDELEERSPGAMAAWRRDPRSRPPDGESLHDLAARVLPCLTRLAAELAGAEVAVVTHSWVARVLVAEALGLGPGGAHRLDLPTGRMATLDWPSERGAVRPTLTGFASEHPPPRGVRWHRGPSARPPG